MLNGLMSPQDQYFAEQEDGDLAEVPPGATPTGVRDDIDIKISEGEIVVPEDVARWHGLKWFMAARDEAKEGLARMSEEGLIKRPEGTIAASEMAPPSGLMSPQEMPEMDLEFNEGGTADSDNNDASGGDASADAGATAADTGPAATTNEDENVAPAAAPAATTGIASGFMGNEEAAFGNPLGGATADSPPATNVGTAPEEAGFQSPSFGRSLGAVGAAFGPPGAALGTALGRGMTTHEDVMNVAAAFSPATALGVGITSGLNALGVPQSGPAAEGLAEGFDGDYYQGLSALQSLMRAPY
jgi:hypothetical protein